MILHEFPNINWLKSQIDTRFANQLSWDGRKLARPNWPNVIINTATHHTVRDNIKGPLSVFSNFSGESYLTLEGRRIKVDTDCFLISNTDQIYTLEIDQNQTETFNVHFGENFMKESICTLVQSDETLLDSTHSTQSLSFFNCLHRKDVFISDLLISLKNQPDEFKQEELMYSLLAHLIAREKATTLKEQSIPALKKQSREELLKRVFIARDYIYAFYNQPITLDEIASACCLSKFHFLKMFTAAFGKTPHQFITTLRIQRAKSLLENSEIDVHRVAEKVGFNNSSSFSRLFFNQTGFYPSQYRVQH